LAQLAAVALDEVLRKDVNVLKREMLSVLAPTATVMHVDGTEEILSFNKGRYASNEH
jgi:hypothetical protein